MTHAHRLERLGSERRPTHVVADALLLRGAAGQVHTLLEWRPPTAACYPSCWDIPGGHVEPDETPEDALVRELREELGIQAIAFRLAAVLDHRDAASRRLYRHFVYLLDEWRGEPQSCEGQELRWVTIAEATALDDLNPFTGFVLEQCRRNGWLG
jgi:8-oxo-dGTP diphosphatase